MERNLMYIGEYAPKNIMQAAVTQEPTPEERIDLLLKFGNNDRTLFTGRQRRNFQQGGQRK